MVMMMVIIIIIVVVIVIVVVVIIIIACFTVTITHVLLSGQLLICSYRNMNHLHVLP